MSLPIDEIILLNHVNFGVFVCVVVIYFCFYYYYFKSCFCTRSGIKAWLGNLLTVKMSSNKYEEESFCGKRKFSLWQRWMNDLLIQQRIHKALLGKVKKP